MSILILHTVRKTTRLSDKTPKIKFDTKLYKRLFSAHSHEYCCAKYFTETKVKGKGEGAGL